MKPIFVSECFDDFILVSRKKPRLNDSEAYHRLAPSEGQKEIARRPKAVQKKINEELI